MASENNLTFTFSGGEGTPPARISIARAHLNKKSFASSMLTTLAAERWQGESKETSFDVSTAESLEASWSAACADVIQQIYESFPEEICEDSPAYVFELPAEVDFEEMLNVLDYFGLQHEFDRLLQASKLQINVKDGNLASQIRAKLFLNNRYYVYEASSYVQNQVIKNPRWIAEIKIPASQIVVPIAINYINRNFWTFGRLELSGARGKGDYLDYDYGTAEARRWIEESAEIKISEVGLPRRKRARTS